MCMLDRECEFEIAKEGVELVGWKVFELKDGKYFAPCADTIFRDLQELSPDTWEEDPVDEMRLFFATDSSGLDELYKTGFHCFVKEVDAIEFSKGRFGRMIEVSPHHYHFAYNDNGEYVTRKVLARDICAKGITRGGEKVFVARKINIRGE